MISRTKVIDVHLLKFTSFPVKTTFTTMEILAKAISALTSHLFMIAANFDILGDDENDSQRLTFS